MSYDLKVLRDNPIGYWSFNNTPNDLTLNANNSYSNDDVLNLTPISAGDVWTNSTGNSDSVTVGQFYTATSYAKTTTGSRNFYTRIDWYKSDNTLITTNFGSTVSANNTSWTQASVTASAPASAIYAITTINVQGATGIADIQFVKSVVFNNYLLPVSRFVAGANTTLSNTTASGYYTSPPIIANSGSSLKILNSSSVVISNTEGKYEAFSKNFENKSFTAGFWFSLNNLLNGNGYGTTPYVNNQLNLFSIKSGSVVIGKVYYDYLSNTIRFSITGTGNSDAYYVVNDLEKQFYVVVNYSNQSSEIIVNGVSGETGLILDTSTMSSYAKTSLSFVIDGSSITGSSTLPTNFLVSSLAFFDYKLSLDQIRSHMLWAGNTEKPIFQSNISASTSIFNFNINPSDYGTHKVISNNDFNTLGTITNLVASNKGLQPVIVPDTTFNTNYDSTASYTISSASGIGWSGSAGVDFSNLSNYFNLYNGLIIGGYLYRTAASTAYTSASGEYIFGISNVNNGQYLFLEYKNVSSSWQYNLNLYNPSDLTTTTLLSAYTASFKDDNFALLINSNFIQLEILSGSVGSSASVLTSSSTSYLPISLGSNSSLTVGNSYHNPKPFLSKINYVNLGDLSITSSSFRSIYTSSYTQTAMTFMLNMSNTLDPFFVSQHGKWEYVLPSANISNSYLLGTSFDWKTMDNCKVTISYDGGNTFSPLNRAQIASGYDLTQSPQNLVINVDIYTNYRLDNNYQSFNNFTYTFYNNLTLYSDAEYYKITPASEYDDVLNLTPISAGDVWTNSTGNSDSVTVGQFYTATSYAKTTTGSRNFYTRIDWYKSDNTLITTNFGSTVSANNTSWTQASVTASAPASAIYAITTINVQGATGIADIQFVKSVVFNNYLLPVSRFVAGANTTLSNTKASSTSLSNYIPQIVDSNIMSRPENFGLKFVGDSSKPTGNATINVPSTSSYNAIEFWYRPDALDSYETNLIQNPSFESQPPAGNGWFATSAATTSRINTQSYIGSYSACVTASYVATTAQIGFSAQMTVTGTRIPATPGTTYTFSAYVRDVNLGFAINPVINFFDSSNIQIASSAITGASVTPSASGWTRIFVTATAPATTASITPRVFTVLSASSSLYNGRSFLVDGALLETSSSVSTYFDGTHTGNLVTNPSFESGSAGWSSNDSATITSASYDSLFGSNSLEVTQAAAFYSGVTTTSNIPASPLTTYTYSYYIKTASGTASIALGNIVHALNSAGTIINQYTQNNITYNASENWTRVINTFTTSATTASVRLFVCNNASPASSAVAGQKFLIDGVMLEQSSSANQYVDSSLISWNGTSGLSTSKLGNSYIINNISSALPSPAIWISASSRFQSLGGTLYINGASVADNNYVASANELYHIALVLSASSNSNLYLNGNNILVPSLSNKSTYGYLQFWNSTPTSANILNRYNQFIGKVPARITDDNTSKIFSISTPSRVVATKIG